MSEALGGELLIIICLGPHKRVTKFVVDQFCRPHNDLTLFAVHKLAREHSLYVREFAPRQQLPSACEDKQQQSSRAPKSPEEIRLLPNSSGVNKTEEPFFALA